MHSFKQAVVLPWGIKKLKQPKSFDKMEEFVQKVIKSIHTFQQIVVYAKSKIHKINLEKKISKYDFQSDGTIFLCNVMN